MSDKSRVSAGALFDTLSGLVSSMKAAEVRGQSWEVEESRIKDEFGNLTDGFEFRIKFNPSTNRNTGAAPHVHPN